MFPRSFRASYGVRQLAAAFFQAGLLAALPLQLGTAASKLAAAKAAACCRTPKLPPPNLN